MTKIVWPRIRERGDKNKAASEILFTLADNDDTYEEYIEIIGQVTTETSVDNTSEAMLNTAYGDTEDIEDISNTLDESFTVLRWSRSL